MSLLSSEETERRAREQVGKTLNGKYQLDALLGVGGMAAVYAATHRNGNRVAIKLLHPELTLSADVLARFIREGYAANRVGHPGAVRVLDDDRAEDGTAFLVMELLEGETLDVIQDSRGMRIAVADLMPWMDQLLDVLAAAHAKEIVHRDIKPENLFLTHGGTLKVLDFGIARMKSAPTASVTRTGNQFGTPPFMSPEQALGRMKEIDARSDLYAVGATMFCLLTGEDVHPAESANEMLVLAATRPARALSSILQDAPQPLCLVVDKALAFDREARWQDARSMQAALRKAHVEVFGEPLPALPEPAESKWTSEAHSTGRGLKIRSGAAPDPARSSAATVAAPSIDRPRRDVQYTAPPISAVPQQGSGSKRWFLVGGGAVAVALFVGVLAVRGPGGDAHPAASAGATTPATSSAMPTAMPAATPAATSPGASPESVSGTASNPTQAASSNPAPAPSGAPAASGQPSPRGADAPATPAAPRRKARPPGAPRPADNSAFEHQ
jgi:eukaryotic-like serine/threonine-protein kinase